MSNRIKVKVKDLRPNPFRNIDDCIMDTEAIEALKVSITETDFWDNIIARKNKGTYEIAFGHHRLAALKELGIKEIDVLVKELSDVDMVKHMVNENYTSIQRNTGAMVQAVEATKFVLEDALNGCKNWGDLGRLKIANLFESEPQFRSVKGKGVGHKTLRKFLGITWKKWMVELSLAIIQKDEVGKDEMGMDESGAPVGYTFRVDRRAVEEFFMPGQARAFRDKIKEIIRLTAPQGVDNPVVKYVQIIPYKEQRQFARLLKRSLIKEEKTLNEGTIWEFLKVALGKRRAEIEEEWAEQYSMDSRIIALEQDLRKIESESSTLSYHVNKFSDNLTEFVKTDDKGRKRKDTAESMVVIKGLSVFLAEDKMRSLLKSLKRLWEVFGYDIFQKKIEFDGTTILGVAKGD